jgi:hypothetical protein
VRVDETASLLGWLASPQAGFDAAAIKAAVNMFAEVTCDSPHPLWYRSSVNPTI